MARWDESPRRRIDARPKNAEGTAQGVRGAHRDMRGKLIGGYMPQVDGSEKAFGTKAGKSESGLDRWSRMNPNAGKFGEKTTAPATAAATPASESATPGLDRWAAMNPNAKKPFTPGSPTGPAVAPAPAASPVTGFVEAAMPKPPVPSPVPVAPAIPQPAPARVARKRSPWSVSPLAKR